MKINLNWYYTGIRNAVLLISFLPLYYLAFQYFKNKLNPNPFEMLSHITGHSSIVILLLSLAITPFRRWLTFVCKKAALPWGKRLADWNVLVRLRRPIALLAFFYACIHLGVYLYLELGFDWEEFHYEMSTRYFIGLGVVAFFIMAILAATSFNAARKKMGRWWVRLHQASYILIVLAIVHFWLSVKVTNNIPKLYAIIAAVLLLHRVVVYFYQPLHRKDDTGDEVYR